MTRLLYAQIFALALLIAIALPTVDKAIANLAHFNATHEFSNNLER